MIHLDIAHLRLHNQLITQQRFEQPHDVVQYLGAVQAQDYGAAKWAVGLRMTGATDDAIEQAFNRGEILRTHIMRPTWHFVSPGDIRWLLKLTSPFVHAANASYYRKQGLDDAILRHCDTILKEALQGSNYLTRTELIAELKKAGIVADDILRFTLILMHAELDSLICSGPRRGKQFTYALLDERVPPTDTLERDEALAELTKRYFTSHGPATLQDFVWWSGLPVANARTGIEMVTSQLRREEIGGQSYWFSSSTFPAMHEVQRAYLLPNFDEYTVAYTDRRAVFDGTHEDKLDARTNSLLGYIMVLDGQVVGIWQRTLKKQEVAITLNPFASLNEEEIQAFTVAANRYGTFLGSPVSIELNLHFTC